MDRQEKEQRVGEIRELLGGAQAVILTHYSGLDVANMVELRSELRKVNARFRVMKNTLVKLATTEMDLEVLHTQFKGPTGVAFTHDDPAAIAKVITEYSKNHPALKVSAAMLDGGKVLDVAGVEALSKLPSKDQLRAKLLSALAGVPRQFVGVLAAPARNLVGVLESRRRALAEQA